MNIGACWIKTTQGGRKYLSCQIQSPGLELNFAMFKNEKKTADNQPDYQIVWSAPRKQGSTPTASTADQVFGDSDVPF